MGDETGDVTELLHALSGKEPQTAARLFALLYGELKRLAAFNMRSERGDHTLTPTALVHEAWIRLSPRGGVQDREHFMALAAQAMRRVLVDHARARRAQSRGGDSTMLSIDWFDVEQPLPAAQLIELDEALNRLAAMKPRVAQVIELRFFGGLTEEEVAGILKVTRRTVNRDWEMARAWLFSQLGSEPG